MNFESLRPTVNAASPGGQHLPLARSDDSQASAPILFFDGDCAFCTRSVRWCLRRDRRGVLRVAPIAGLTYAALSIHERPIEPDSALLWDGAAFHQRGEMAVRVLSLLGLPMSGAGLLIGLTPRFVRDAAYEWIAHRRHQLSSGRESCLIPEPGWAARLLP
ncbi:MAG: DUF393 domain-containing protein [Planctomycetes bacterium]|nr:DUF393 domain-containing protein [Planctomycetota bacterium]